MSRLRLIALLTTLLTLLGVGLSARERFFCQMREQVVDACCCGSSCLPGVSSSRPELKRPDCCVRLAPASLPASAARRDAWTPSAVSALPGVRTVDVLPPPYMELLDASPGAARAVVARGPPLFLRHCALLI